MIYGEFERNSYVKYMKHHYQLSEMELERYFAWLLSCREHSGRFFQSQGPLLYLTLGYLVSTTSGKAVNVRALCSDFHIKYKLFFQKLKILKQVLKLPHCQVDPEHTLYRKLAKYPLQVKQISYGVYQLIEEDFLAWTLFTKIAVASILAMEYLKIGDRKEYEVVCNEIGVSYDHVRQRVCQVKALLLDNINLNGQEGRKLHVKQVGEVIGDILVSHKLIDPQVILPLANDQ